MPWAPSLTTKSREPRRKSGKRHTFGQTNTVDGYAASPQNGRELKLLTRTKRCLQPALLRHQAQEARNAPKEARKVRAREKGPKEDVTVAVAHITKQIARWEKEPRPSNKLGTRGSQVNSQVPASKHGEVGSRMERGKEKQENDEKDAKEKAKELLTSNARNGTKPLGISSYLSEPWGGVA